jgi:hypothetical protein
MSVGFVWDCDEEENMTLQVRDSREATYRMSGLKWQ